MHFSKSHAAKRVPYDAYAFQVFDGEEISYGVRLYTHGYDLYIPGRRLIYHQYGSEKPPGTKLYHQINWPEKAKEQTPALRRLLHIMEMPYKGRVDMTDIERFGMGKQRTVLQYQQFAHMNFTTHEMEPNLNCIRIEKDELKILPYVLPEPKPVLQPPPKCSKDIINTAYLTVVSDVYSMESAAVLRHALTQWGSPHKLVILVSFEAPSEDLSKLESLPNVVVRYIGKDLAYTIMSAWSLIDFSKLIFVSPYTVLLDNIDMLFCEQSDFAAVAAVAQLAAFDTSLMVITPSITTYDRLTAKRESMGQVSASDLNSFFNQFYTDNWKSLPYYYNTQKGPWSYNLQFPKHQSYLLEHERDIKLFSFGNMLPWQDVAINCGGYIWEKANHFFYNEWWEQYIQATKNTPLSLLARENIELMNSRSIGLGWINEVRDWNFWDVQSGNDVSGVIYYPLITGRIFKLSSAQETVIQRHFRFLAGKYTLDAMAWRSEACHQPLKLRLMITLQQLGTVVDQEFEVKQFKGPMCFGSDVDCDAKELIHPIDFEIPEQVGEKEKAIIKISSVVVPADKCMHRCVFLHSLHLSGGSDKFGKEPRIWKP